MPDGIVAFDLSRFAVLPRRLARLAGELDEAARHLSYVDHPAGAAAAAAVDELAGWVHRQRALVAQRWAQLQAIPHFQTFVAYDHDVGRIVYEVGWLTGSEPGMVTEGQLRALGAYWHEVAPVLWAVERGDELGAEEVAAAFDALAAAAEDPAAAAAVLRAMGVEGYWTFLAIADAGAGDDDDAVARAEAELGRLTGLLAAATNAPAGHGLDPSFLDDLLADAEAIPAVDRPTPSEYEEAMAALTELDFSREVAARIAAVTGPRGAVAVLNGVGGAVALLTLPMPLVAAAEHGLFSPELAESAVTTTLSLASFLTTGPASVASFGLGVLAGLIFASARNPGSPRRATRGGGNPGGPGTGTADLHLDDHGVPVPANGR